MRTDTHKEWTDAFRESFPEEVRPADGGWEAVAGRMRRAAARRRAAIAAAVLALPIAGGVFFLTRPDAGQSLIDVQDNPGLVAQVAENRSEPAVLSDALSEHGSMANVPPVLADASPEHGDATNMPPVLTDASPEHSDAANVPPVLTDASPEHGGAANVPPVLTDASPEHGDMDPFEEDEAPARRKERRMSVGVNGSSAVGGVSTSSISTVRNIATKSGDLVSDTPSAPTYKQDFNYALPVSLGVSLRYSLTDRISIGTGLDYTYLHSHFGQMNTKVHLAGIPLEVDYKLYSAGPADFYAGIGGKVEKVLKARLADLAVNEPELLWSGAIHLGAQTPISGKALLFVQPELSYYFTNTYLSTYRTENRLSLTVKAGIRFDIDKL